MPHYYLGSFLETCPQNFANATSPDHQLSSHIMGESVTSQPTKGVGISSETPSPPAAASIYGIVRRHCRERLLVPPLLWTNRHLELLQMSFDEPTLAPETERLDYYSKRWSKPVGKRVLKSYLKRFDLLEYREKYIQALFYGWESPFTPDTFVALSLYFHRDI